MKKVSVNFFYQSLFQITKIIIPIISIPIVSSALGPAGVGKYNYTNSIVQYFILFGSMGISIYGNREIAMVSKQKEKLTVTFSEIFFLKAILSSLMLMIYYAFIFFRDDSIFLFVQSLSLIAVLFDVSWLFMGVEDFKRTSLVSLVIQILTLISIIYFVKSPSDTLGYIFIQAFGNLLSQSLVWFFVSKYARLVKVNLKACLSHVKGSFNYFIPQVAIVLYTNLNKTILGIFIGVASVGFYTSSLTLNNVFITIITTIDIVLLPHMSGLFAKNNVQKIISLMEKTIHLQLFFSIPLMFGVLTVYDKLIPWFFSEKFLFINNVVPIFSILIVITPLGMAISRQYLMPIGKTSDYNKSVILGAIINVCSNLLLIPLFGFYGVVISNILAELFVTTIRTYYFLKETSFKFKVSKIVNIFIASFIMMLITRFVTQNLNASFLTNLIQMTVAIPIYILLVSIFKSNIAFDLIKEKNKY